jgi:creatinine amidohydrolase
MYDLEELTASALRRLLEKGVETAVVPFGSIEYHGGHLPIGADAVLADAVGHEVARKLGAVRAPTVPVGYAEHQQHFVGTMTLRADTLRDVAVQLADGLARQGFRRIALVSTHGGNRMALDAAVARVSARSSGAVVCAPPGDVGPQPGTHSGEWLTSVMLALRPDLVELQNASDELSSELRTASAERGTHHIERFVASIVAGVREATLLG